MNDPNDQNYPAISVGRKQMRSDGGVFLYEADEFHSEISKTLSIATKASTVFYSVPTGKKLHLRTIEYTQAVKAFQRTVKLKDGSGTTKFAFGLSSNVSNYGRTGLIGITFTGNITIIRNSKSTGLVTIGGVLDPQDDGY